MSDQDLSIRDKMLASLSSPIMSALDKNGMTMEKWVEGLVKLSKAEEEKAFKSKDEPIVYSKPLPKHDVQLKAHEVIGKTAGWLREHVEIEGEIVNYSPEQAQAIRMVAKEVVERIRRGELK